jgi:lipid A 3-O-deacylase
MRRTQLQLTTTLCLLAFWTTLTANNPTDSIIWLSPIPAPAFKGYARVQIENDMLIARHKTDRYFSSGVRLDYLFVKNPTAQSWLSKLFPRLQNADNFVGFTASSSMYTPANKAEQVIVGDRPYAGWLHGGVYHISNSAASATRFKTEYTVGVIGKAAMQEEMQKNWHQVINRPQPLGWDNQIASDVALTVNFKGEKRLLQPAEHVDLIGFAEANIGTVMNYGGVGGMMRLGWFEDYFANILPLSKNAHKSWQAFVFIRPSVRIVADNALLQGGIFTYDKSPYVIQRDDLARYYMETEFGYSLSYRNINMTYSQSIRTPEFNGARNMFWGGLSCSVGF